MQIRPEPKRISNLALIPAAKREMLSRASMLAEQSGMPLYLAGGVVRDLLLSRPILDLDVVVEGDAIRLVRNLARREGGKATTHPKFGTGTWEMPAGSIDLATARTESYEYPGALPAVRFASIHDDLVRRDFTINAMALRVRPDGQPGELLDPFGGQEDLAKRLVRVLHPGSFLDDPTRMFRAIRYARRYGFEMEPQTLKLLNDDSRRVLSSLSGERLRHELDLVLDEEDSAVMLEDASRLGLVSSLHPALHKPPKDFARLCDSVPDPRLNIQPDRRLLGYLLWLMDLAPDMILLVQKRLDFGGTLARVLTAASVLRAELDVLRGAAPSAWTLRLDKVPPMAVYALYLHTEEPALASYLVKWRYITSNIDGNELKRRGLVPGPFFKEVLSRLRAAWLDGEVSSAAEENALLEKILRE
jgi:tRNA nucleotidyltransferase (CCA-adding enzyme)